MNEKTKKFLTDARNKAEDAIVKAKAFIEKHPVACTIGGIAASSVIAGAIGKKVGYDKGVDDEAGTIVEWLKGDNQILDHIPLIASNEVLNDEDQYGRALYAASIMNLKNNEAAVIAKSFDGKLVIDRVLNKDIRHAIIERLKEEVPKAQTFTYTDPF